MGQPQPPQTRQSKPPAKPADMDALHSLTPGGPILPRPQPDNKANPTDRGDEANTRMHRGTPNPEQKGSDIRHGDHNPGMAQAGHTHDRQGRGAPSAANERTADKSTKMAPPEPDPMGVRKNCD
jgi:hypothetical protein